MNDPSPNVEAIERFMTTLAANARHEQSPLPSAQQMWMLIQWRARQDAQRRRARRQQLSEIAVPGVVVVLLVLLGLWRGHLLGNGIAAFFEGVPAAGAFSGVVLVLALGLFVLAFLVVHLLIVEEG